MNKPRFTAIEEVAEVYSMWVLGDRAGIPQRFKEPILLPKGTTDQSLTRGYPEQSVLTHNMKKFVTDEMIVREANELWNKNPTT